MNKTPFFSKHIDFGANMVDFFGFSLPIYYEGINIEHKHVRESVGLFDVSHMGQLIIEGENAHDFLQKLTTNESCGKYVLFVVKHCFRNVFRPCTLL